MRKKYLINKTRYSVVAAMIALSLIFSSCGSRTYSGKTNTESEGNSDETDNTAGLDSDSKGYAVGSADYAIIVTEGVNVDLTGDYSEKAIKAEWSIDEAKAVISSDNNVSGGSIASDGSGDTENGSDITVNGSGVTVEERTVTITDGGTYVLQGTVENVQLVINADKEDNVQLVFNGVSLSNKSGDQENSTSVVYAKQAKNLYITLAEGTENYISDKRQAATEISTEMSTEASTVTSTEASDSIKITETTETDLSSAIYSECDIILNGSGKLTVEGGYKDGISTRDDMEIIDGTYVMNTYDDAFVGKDSISIRSGDFKINSETGDGFKSSNSEDKEKGYIVVDGGNMDISAGSDGIHAEYALVINNGTILIRDCDEGLEAMNVVINDGKININAKDDGINVSEAGESANVDFDKNPYGNPSQDGDNTYGNHPQRGERPEGTPPPKPEGKTSASENGEKTSSDITDDSSSDDTKRHGGRPEMKNVELPDGAGTQGGMKGMQGDNIDGALIINGGSLLVTSDGDGLDSNGDLLITGGNIMVNGTESGGNGSLDYADSFDITGGTLVVAGSNGMEEPIQTTSDDIRIITAQFDSKVSAETEVQITDNTGKEIMTFKPAHDITYVSMASDSLDKDETYAITAGEASVTAEDRAIGNR